MAPNLNEIWTEEVHQRILDRIRRTTRKEWLEKIARYEAEYAEAEAEEQRLMNKSRSASADSHERAA